MKKINNINEIKYHIYSFISKYPSILVTGIGPNKNKIIKWKSEHK